MGFAIRPRANSGARRGTARNRAGQQSETYAPHRQHPEEARRERPCARRPRPPTRRGAGEGAKRAETKALCQRAFVIR